MALVASDAGCGARVPLYCTASDKLFLVFMFDKQRETMLRTLNLQAVTEHSINNVDTLLYEKVTIRNRGYAFDQEEFALELVEIAVPVRDAAVEVRTALAVHAPCRPFIAETSSAAPARHAPDGRTHGRSLVAAAGSERAGPL